MINQLIPIEIMVEQVTELFAKGGNPNMLESVKKYIHSLSVMGVINKLQPNQVYQFIKTAWELKLDPLKKEIYPIVRNTKDGVVLTVTVSYLEYLKRASTNSEFIPPNLTTVTTDKEGKPLLPKDYYCIFEGYIKSRPDYVCKRIFYMREWYQSSPTWDKMPVYMLEKTALKNGLVWMYPNCMELDRIFREEENGIKISGESVYVGNIKDTQEKEIQSTPITAKPTEKLFIEKPTKKTKTKLVPEFPPIIEETGEVVEVADKPATPLIDNSELIKTITNLATIVPADFVKEYMTDKDFSKAKNNAEIVTEVIGAYYEKFGV